MGSHNSNNWYQSQVDEKSAKKPKYPSNMNMTHRVRNGRYMAEIKSKDPETQLWDTR